MIFNPQASTDTVTDAQASALERVTYLIGLERAWVHYIDALSAHPVYAPKREGVAYKGYASLAELMAAMNAQNAEIAAARVTLRGIRVELYGNEWGN